jgi:putative DNA primase/helicase
MRNADKILAAFEGNAYPAMFESLSRSLGVSADSLQRLGLGWAPVVRFRSGLNTQGWWVIPERDTAGSPVGLALRARDGRKVMYPGSNHGLVYPLNPNHEVGRETYRRGAHNWIRVGDQGLECPVCGGEDGCMVSAEDPEDPKAVICVRSSHKAVRPMRLGYLHLLKPEGRIRHGASPLAGDDGPVLVVEGMTDTAAAMDLGFVAVGRPSNLACMDMLRNLVHGREVIIVGENDPINPMTGKSPGQEGMVAAYQVLKAVCPRVKMVSPPSEFKDLRRWLVDGRLTRDAFLEYVEEEAKHPVEDTVLPDDSPLTIANAWLASAHRMAGRTVLRYYEGRWYRYVGTKYAQVDEMVDIRGPLHGWAANKSVSVEKADGSVTLKPLSCNRRVTGDIMEALTYPCPVRVPSVPAWINDAVGPNPKDLIAFSNGLLHLPAYLDGANEDEYLLDHTPDFFNTLCLPFAFDPFARCPTWHRYLATSLGDEEAKIDLLQEWFGLNLIQDTSYHKMMLMRGVKRSGKGTAMAALEAILGKENVGATTFKQLTSRFGLESLVGKQAIFMGDARLPQYGDSMAALEMLLNIVGEDPLYVDRKYTTPLSNYRVQGRFTIATNLLPNIPDHSGALEARLLILDFEQSFLGREDFSLRDKLIEEAAGIAIWAMKGLQRLRESGRFTIPESSKEALREWRALASPVASFLDECCTDGPKLFIAKSELFNAWENWAQSRRLDAGNQSEFLERVKHHLPFATSRVVEIGGRCRHVFAGVDLTDAATRQYLRPG